MSIDRDSRAARLRRAQWGGALLAAVAVVMTPPLGAGSYTLSIVATSYLLDDDVSGEPRLSLMGGALIGAIALALLVGSALIVSALLGRPRPRPITMAGAVSLIVGTALFTALPLAPGFVFSLFGVPYLVVFALMGFGASACVSAWSRRESRDEVPREESPGGIVSVLVATTLLPLIVLALGLVEAFVWGPASQTEGLTAAEVWAALNPADASLAVANIVGWAVIGALLSLLPLVVAVLTRRRPEATPARRRSAIIVSGLFAGGMVASLHWVGTFSLGMSIADTLPPYTGSLSVPGEGLLFAGSVLLASALCATLAARPASRPPSSRLPEVTPAR